TSRSQVGSVTALPGGDVSAGAGAGLRDSVGGGVQSRSAHGEEIRADVEPQAVRQAVSRYLPLGANRLRFRVSRGRPLSGAPPASVARAASRGRPASVVRPRPSARRGSGVV